MRVSEGRSAASLPLLILRSLEPVTYNASPVGSVRLPLLCVHYKTAVHSQPPTGFATNRHITTLILSVAARLPQTLLSTRSSTQYSYTEILRSDTTTHLESSTFPRHYTRIMANRRQPAAAAKGKKSRKPSAKKNTHKPMEETEATQPDRLTPDSGFSLLLDLPPELRVRIYEYAVWTKDNCWITKAGGVPEPPLLMTSNAVRKEAIDVYYSINAIHYVVTSYDFGAETLLFRKLDILKARYGIEANVTAAQFNGPPSWPNLRSCLQSFQKGTGRHVRLGIPPAGGSKDDKIMIGMMRSAVAMRSLPWKEAEANLELLRVGLVAIDDRWASN
jgi:hypothetical protein